MQKYIKSWSDHRQEKKEKMQAQNIAQVIKTLFLMAFGAIIYNIAINANDAIISYFIGI